MTCYDHVAVNFLSKRFYFFQSTFIFCQSAFIFSDTCVIFLRLFIIALLFSFIALYHSAFVFFQSALSQRFYSIFPSARKRFIIALLFNFSKCKKALYHSAFIQFFLNASKCLFFILLSMKQCPILFSKTLISFYFNFQMCKHTIS